MSRIKQRVGALCASLLLVGAMVFGTAAPASASTTDPASCVWNNACLWEHVGGQGARIAYGGNMYGTCFNMPAGWNDRVSSVRNDITYSIRLYVNANCSDWAYIVISANGGNWNDLHAWGFGDNISAIFLGP